jgi:hypothetical protein
MSKPTRKDANILLQAATLMVNPTYQEASTFVLSPRFITEYEPFVAKFPRGSQEFTLARRACAFYETLGTLWKHGLFHEDLLFDWLSIDYMWRRLKGFALGLRAEVGSPALYEHFEAMAQAETEWSERQGK